MFHINQLMNHFPSYIIGLSIKRFIIIIIKSYQYMISGFFPNACRFTPSCSNYAIQALQKHGVLMGGWLTFLRISKCHPLYNQTGYDPVP